MINFMATTIALQVLLAPQQTVPLSSPLPIEVSIHNTASTPVTLLDWNTPLDPSAGPLGVVKVYDAQTGNELPINQVVFERGRPPAIEEFIEIPSDTTVKRTLQVPVEDKDIQAGREYTVRAEGTWHAVWYSALDETTKEQRGNLANATRGDFLSNVGRVRVE